MHLPGSQKVVEGAVSVPSAENKVRNAIGVEIAAGDPKTEFIERILADDACRSNLGDRELPLPGSTLTKQQRHFAAVGFRTAWSIGSVVTDREVKQSVVVEVACGDVSSRPFRTR
jgi:hypothetical protein